MKQIVAGMIAHVDAGKTTLSEALLYRSGALRQLGRVAMPFWIRTRLKNSGASRFFRTKLI